MFNLREHCFTDNELGDNFVGIRSKNNNLQICFPLGFHLNTNNIRIDIRRLISVLSNFNETHTNFLFTKNENKLIEQTFPLIAYKNVIEYFLSHDYYKERESIYQTTTKGKINFAKTIKRNRPIIQNNNSLVYIEFQTKKNQINENELVTAINKYCVYEAFSKFGFAYNSYKPLKFNLPTSKKECLYVLQNKLNNTFDDSKRILFNSMINILTQKDKELKEDEFKFGTTKFHTIWEKMIDIAFGIKDKYRYFPQTKWELKYTNNKDNSLLQPDTIMIDNKQIYILDAKYYKYGINLKELPQSSDITKQVAYGEYSAYISKNKNIHNAFLMPYNKQNNKFNTKIDSDFKNIGKATIKWKNHENYATIQGILVDTRFLIYNYDKISIADKEKLAKAISDSKF
ncbi:LlaJI family restriction endonuclease [Campylobacter jejuni]|nr:LlaJI family restriction endonuclease [Campylobacter coli]EAH5694493.1 LlaJI family restriction endonuclease [Campylobacter jejuni]EAC2140312.1 LlaJI family restriction endonuclease [Campylobacter coli]EAH4940832.1 LlaJI family restriction endonuclease [Campylobacter coli]EAH4942697.1 LlaJI family restriction endonuclease [Campylobacter coli]EAH4949684.1 LlaJI family restriction endonuclease [Campylobacter coli]